MFRQKGLTVLSLAMLLGMLLIGRVDAASAATAPPARGTVVEGQSVPGLALGSTRARSIAVWGNPSYCQSAYPAIQVLCTYNLSSGGSVDLNFSGPGGTPSTGSGSDIVATIDWIGIPGWRTTAGVTTASALAHPGSVITAYPQGQVRRYGDGHLYSVTDKHLGIQVLWLPQTYTSQFYVQIEIFPRT